MAQVFRKDIVDTLKHNREQLSESSCKTYTAMLFNLHKRMGSDDYDISWFKKNQEDVMKHIDDMESKQSQKTLLSALYVLTEDEDYKDKMKTVCKEVNDRYATQKMTPKQEENRITFEQVREVFEGLKSTLKKHVCADNYINLLLVGVMGGIFIPPRRNEWGDVKTRDFDKETDNFIVKHTVTFNKYKTVSKYGRQTVQIPKELYTPLRQWLKVNDSEYLFCNPNNGRPLTSSDVSKRLKAIFGRSIGCDALRSIYVSHKYKDLPSMAEMEETATALGHSLSTELTVYRKLP